MSYQQGYQDQQQHGYGQNQYDPYAAQGNPYSEQGNPYAQDSNPYGGAGYGQQQQQPHASSRYDEEQGQAGYEMGNLNGNDPNRILNECRSVDSAIEKVERDLQRLRSVQKSYLDSTDSSPDSGLSREVDSLSSNIMQVYQALTRRVKNLKQDRESGSPRNSAQVGKIDRRLKAAINSYQQLDRDYRHKNEEQIARNYRIVRPDASEAEVREAVESGGNQQVFSSALVNSTRRGEAQSAQRNVNDRHRAIQKIEQDMEKLAMMFQDLDALVVQQEAAVTQIEQRGEEVTDHVAKANVELTGAVDKARAARKKKWYCIGIVVLVIIILAVVLGVVFGRK